MPGPLCQSTYGITYGEAQRKFFRDIILYSNSYFFIKKPKHNEPHVDERLLQLLLSDSVDDLKLQPVSSLIFCLSNAWHLDETV